MFVLKKISGDPSVFRYDPPRDPLSGTLRTLRRVNIALAARLSRRKAPMGLGYLSDDRSRYGGHPWRHLPESDLIHLHWIAGFVDHHTFFDVVPTTKPVIWTLHDMAAFTGGCHYNGACNRLTQACGRCPQLGSESDTDLSRQIWLRKSQTFRKLRREQLHIVTPSRWLGEQVGHSSLLSRFPRSVIPNGVDTKVFAPRDRQASRSVLRIPQEAKVVLFLAHGVHDPRKGFHLFTSMLASLESVSDLYLLSVGSGLPLEFRTFPHTHVEHVSDDRFLSYVYSAADIFVVPSLQDNLPNTVLESISCGTPVVGFGVGGVPDMVRPGLTGLLATPGDAGDLRRTIVDLLKNAQLRKEMAINCRKIAMQEYTLEIQARHYLQLYSDVLGTARADERRPVAPLGTGSLLIPSRA
jgi:glycosyltransferase involved in cell wall biosynthesis